MRQEKENSLDFLSPFPARLSNLPPRANQCSSRERRQRETSAASSISDTRALRSAKPGDALGGRAVMREREDERKTRRDFLVALWLLLLLLLFTIKYS